MADTRKVRAVEGRLFPWENNPRRGHVGWSPTPEGEEHDHEIPGVVKLSRSDDAIEVPDNTYYRRGIADGDLEDASDEHAEEGEELQDAAEFASDNAEPAPDSAEKEV